MNILCVLVLWCEHLGICILQPNIPHNIDPTLHPIAPPLHSDYIFCSFQQVKTGFLMNILCVLVLTLGVNTWGYAYFHLGTLPTWANNYNATDSIALHNVTTVSPYQLVTWGNTSHNIVGLMQITVKHFIFVSLSFFRQIHDFSHWVGHTPSL